ncbi:MAG: serine hydrolase [Planctomycetota bacterium]|nr:serine hydrolase [Planctomycetota bacterium]
MSSSYFRATLAAGLVVWLTFCGPYVLAETLPSRLEPLIEDHAGQVAIAIEHLETHESFRHRSAEPMPTASLIKFPIMIEAYRQSAAGKIDFDEVLELHEADKVPGAGILTPHFSAGVKLKTMEELGFPNTKLHSKVYQRETSIFPDRSKQFGLGSTTADEMVGLLSLLQNRKLVSPEASDAMRAHLLTCDDKLKFPRFLPDGTKIAFKTGSVEAARTAAGILETPKGPVAICVLTSENADRRWTDDNEGDLLCARVAREVLDYFTPVPKEGIEADDGCGGLPGEINVACVECEVVPSPATSDSAVDDVVEADGKGLEPAASEVTLTAAASTKPLAPMEPADPLTGKPFVCCQTWAVADAKTGSLLWNHPQAGAVREVASTTKIMTALVAMKAVAADPALLKTEVTFDEPSDQTPGSSCGLNRGEKLSFRDLLFGMLLPSGNDAAVAVGRFLGDRFEPAAKSGATDRLSRFVAEMNREAGRLGLKESRYLNPHGLPQSKHTSSARDLARLTSAALRDDLFRKIVATREYTAEVRSPEGKARTVVWRNTNRLLGIEGYRGVKTGYTKAAGSCLVSTGIRGKDELIVVVLGSPSAGAAASDSRNLYRWAWNERGHKK